MHGLSEQREAGIILVLCPWSASLPGAPASTLPGRKSCGKELKDPLGRQMFLNERSEIAPNVHRVQNGKDRCGRKGKGKGRDDLAFIKHLL